MRKIRILILAISILFGGMLCAQTIKYPTGIEHVVVIGVDAMSVAGLKTANTPNMDKLIENGALCNRVRTVQPSTSSPNWGSMLAGAGPEIHGISNNDWHEDDRSLMPTVVDDQNYFPTVVAVVRAQRPKGAIGMIYHWDGFGRLFEKGLANVDQKYPSDAQTAEAIVSYIKKEKPMFVFSHFDDVDDAGHEFGHMTAKYLHQIEITDKYVGQIMQAIKDAGIESTTMVMIVSDHGGIGYGHGGSNWQEVTVPFILSGAGVKKNYKVPTDIYMFDVAPTITFALGCRDPYAWRGKAIQCAFEGFDVPVDPLNLKRLTPPPSINGGRHLFAQAGGLYIDKTATVTMTTEEFDSKIYYTTDGSIPTRKSTEYTKPFELTKTTVVRAKSFNNNGRDESLTADGYFRIIKKNDANGVHASFYRGRDWSAVPNFSLIKPEKNWTSHEIQLDKSEIDAIAPKVDDSFGIKFVSQLQIDEAGEYTFYLQSDDGSNLYIENKQVVNNDGDHGVIEKQGSIKLSEGRHELRVEFINAGGGYWIDAFYKGPNTPKQIIPANKLYLK